MKLLDTGDALECIVSQVPEEDAFVAQLACKTLHVRIKERFANSGGVRTTSEGVVSSQVRFDWVLSFPEKDRPKWLLRWDRHTSRIIARGGGLEVLQWGWKEGHQYPSYTCYGAARGGHIDILQWARENGCGWDKSTCEGAAAGGFLEILKWLRLNACPWNARTCQAAAQGGHLEVLQ